MPARSIARTRLVTLNFLSFFFNNLEIFHVLSLKNYGGSEQHLVNCVCFFQSEMFGKPFGTSTTSSAFGTGSSIFGSSSSKPTVGFGSTSTTQSGGLFGQKPLFGSSTQQSSLFGATQPAATTSSSLFGQSKPLFGSTTTSQPNAFGGATSIFGSSQTTQSGSLFSSSFGSASHTGTTIKFDPPMASDTMLRNGTNQTISTKHMCITAMKQYEGKSLEELRCEDYIANRRGTATGTGLSFGQTQPATSTSLFGSTTTQSSLFGTQNKPFFGGTSTFGSTTTTTPSLFGSTTTTGTSLFGTSKPTTGSLFGSTQISTASPFGQTQTGGLFGSKPATSFGSQQPSSLFGGTSTFGSTTTTSSPFTFGSATATSTPFGQTQTTPAFGAFGQPAASTATTGLFGAKPATTGFGGFGTSTTTSAPFGGTPFGGTATSTSLFGSTAAKPAASLFGAPTGQTGFGSTAGATNVVAAPTAPIVLGADVNQTLIQNAIIEAQLASCPYGDSPLLKLVSNESLKKADIPSPTNMERQMRFLASKAQGSTTTTTRSIIMPRSSILPVGSPIAMPGQWNNSRPVKQFSYKSMYSSPSFDALPNSPFDDSNSKLSILKRVSGDANTSIFADQSGVGKEKYDEPRQDIKRLDLNRLHKSLEESRQRRSVPDPVTVAGDSRDRDTVDAQRQTPVQEAVSDGGGGAAPRPLISPETENAREKRRAELRIEQPPRLNLNADSMTNAIESTLNVSDGTASAARSNGVTHESPEKPHPAGIRLRRRDYICEPSLERLAIIAEHNGGVCHLEKGFTLRRLAYGSVFWPGPFDLSNIDLDEVVHFRQNEVCVYPNDASKPPVGEQLNRFAEISLERVWPHDKITKEPITDPTKLEQIHFREKLERVSARMGANFKDYRPDTGTWVFTVPHFTKYGLPDDESDDDAPSPEQLRTALNESRLQDALQRDRLHVSAQHLAKTIASLPSESITAQDDRTDANVRILSDISEMPTPYHNGAAFGSVYASELKNGLAPIATILDFDQTIGSTTFTPAKGIREGKHKTEPADESLQPDEISRLDELMEDSFAINLVKSEARARRIKLKAVEPCNDLSFVLPLRESFVTKMRMKRETMVDEALRSLRRTRIGWARGGMFANSALPTSFDVHLLKLEYPDEIPRDYIVDMFEHNIRLSCRSTERCSADEAVGRVVIGGVQPSRDYAQMVDSFIATSEQSKMIREESVWRLCSALFTHPSHLNVSSDYVRGLAQRDCVGNWLRETIAAKRLKLPASSNKRILFHVLSGNLSEAVDEAIAANYPLLAVALSSFMEADRTPYKEQIEFWTQSQAVEFIDEDLLKIYMVMAGMMHADLKTKRLFVCDGLNWMRALGVFVWYHCPHFDPLGEVLSAFEEDLRERGCRESLGTSVIYELMKLSSDRSHPLEVLLDPCAFIDCPLDFHLSWHLWCVLRSIGYDHIESSVELSLHVNYAQQLAVMELFHLAIFVLMHIDNANARQSAVMEMVDRVAPEADDALYEKMRDLCGLPPEVIAHSKFMRAKLEGNDEAMCVHALDARMYNEAHALFYESVAPKAITLGDHEFLGRLVERFEAKCDKIPCWGLRGQVYADYHHMKEGIHEISDESHVESLLDLARSLEPRLCSMSARTPLQSLSISMMSRLVYEIIARFESKQLVDMPFSMEEALQATCSAATAAIHCNGFEFDI
uniref:Nuclear pore complex protein Nup98-Nup96 n=1 Tax=Parascaris univalens TaxID=6257 RepID=A0A915APT2_PARUN